MTDPNTPDDRPHTTINNITPERSGGGGAGMAFLIGAIVVVVAVIAWFVFAGGSVPTAPENDVDVKIDLPEAPKLPEPPANPLPDAPDITPPTAPQAE